MNSFFLSRLMIRFISILILPLVMLCFVAIVIGKMLHNIRWLPDEGGWGFILNYPFGQFNFYSSHKQVYAIVHNIQAVSAFEFVR